MLKTDELHALEQSQVGLFCFIFFTPSFVPCFTIILFTLLL